MIRREPCAGRDHGAKILGKANHGMRLSGMDDAVCPGMFTQHVAHHLKGRFRIILAGREFTGHIAAENVNRWFIDRDPIIYQVLEGRNHLFNETCEEICRFVIFPTTFFIDPNRVGKVMQGEHGLQPKTAHPN